jgi:hypothetical protein
VLVRSQRALLDFFDSSAVSLNKQAPKQAQRGERSPQTFEASETFQFRAAFSRLLLPRAKMTALCSRSREKSPHLAR